MRKKNIIGKITTVILGTVMLFSFGTVVKAYDCPGTGHNEFYLNVNAYEGETWDVTTCYRKYTTSYMCVETNNQGYGYPIEVSAIGRNSGGLFYDGFADCSGGRTYYINNNSGGVYLYNLVVESGYSYAGLYGRDTVDAASKIIGHFHTDV